jgi:hypothetical protein
MQPLCKIQKLKAPIWARIGVGLIISNQNTYTRSLNSPSRYIPCSKSMPVSSLTDSISLK